MIHQLGGGVKRAAFVEAVGQVRWEAAGEVVACPTPVLFD